MNIEPINNELIVQRVYEYFCNALINGDLKPGDKLLPEDELAKEFGIGRSTVREAKKMMAAIGLFKVSRGNGTYVSDTITPSIFNPLLLSMIVEGNNSKDVYELRVMFDTAIYNLICDKCSDASLMDIREMVDHYIELYKNGERDINVFMKQEEEFHSMIYALTMNPLIIRLANMINGLFKRYIFKALQEDIGIERSLRHHLEILDVLQSRNKEAIKTIVEDTLEEWRIN